MKHLIYLALTILFPQLIAAQSVDSIKTTNFYQEGKHLVIDFDLPYGKNAWYTYTVTKVKILAGASTPTYYNARTISGDLDQLRPGQQYKIRWDVIEDVHFLDTPQSATITYRLSNATMNKIEEDIRSRQTEKEAEERRQLEKEIAIEEAKWRRYRGEARKYYTFSALVVGGTVLGLSYTTKGYQRPGFFKGIFTTIGTAAVVTGGLAGTISLLNSASDENYRAKNQRKKLNSLKVAVVPALSPGLGGGQFSVVVRW